MLWLIAAVSTVIILLVAVWLFMPALLVLGVITLIYAFYVAVDERAITRRLKREHEALEAVGMDGTQSAKKRAGA